MTGSRLATPDGTSLAYTIVPGTGSLVLAIHGFTGDSTTMRPLAESLAPDHEVVLVDVVGHGRSDSPEDLEPYRMSSVVDQMLTLVADRDPGTAHLVGYSMGGRIVLSMADRAPWFFGSVTTLSSTAGLDDPRERAQRHDRDLALADRIERIGVEAFVDEWLDQPLFDPLRHHLGMEALAVTKAARARASATGLSQSLRGTGTGAMTPVWDGVARLRYPVLAMSGSLDPTYVQLADRLAATARDGRSIVIDGCGHALPMENPAAVATHLRAFLEGCDRYS